MSHFYGSVQGGRGEATRGGHKNTGLDVTAASWQGSVQVRLWFDDESGEDMARVYLEPWYGRGEHVELYRGPVSGEHKS